MFVCDALRASRVLAATTSTSSRRLRLGAIGPPSPCAATHRLRHSTAAAAGASEGAAVTPSPTPADGDSSSSSTDAVAAIHARFAGRTCLIQGASRGLGLEFVRQLLDVHGTTVVATCRNPATATQLQLLQQQQQQQLGTRADAAGEVGSSASRLHVVRLDLCEDASIQRAAEEVSELVPSLDLLVNCSAVLHGPDGMAPETSYSRIRGDHMALSFATNAIGPMMVCRSFLPLLLRSPGATEQQPALVANLSARVGSLADNRLGGWYSYRASKAALNQMSLTLALELRRKRAPAAMVMLHPGTCDTDLSRPYHRNVPPGKLFDRTRAVRQLLGILAGISVDDSGRFIAWDGQDVPW